MTTHFKQFTSIELAWDYQAQRSRLGHNTRLLTVGKKDHRVFFSSRHVDIANAIDVKDLP